MGSGAGLSGFKPRLPHLPEFPVPQFPPCTGINNTPTRVVAVRLQGLYVTYCECHNAITCALLACVPSICASCPSGDTCLLWANFNNLFLNNFPCCRDKAIRLRSSQKRQSGSRGHWVPHRTLALQHRAAMPHPALCLSPGDGGALARPSVSRGFSGTRWRAGLAAERAV